MSGQTATLAGRVATSVIPASGTQPDDQEWGKKQWNCKGIAEGSRGWRASPLLVSHHNLRIIWRINPAEGRPGSWDLSWNWPGTTTRLSRGKGCRGLKGLTLSATCTHGLTASDLVISLKPMDLFIWWTKNWDLTQVLGFDPIFGKNPNFWDLQFLGQGIDYRGKRLPLRYYKQSRWLKTLWGMVQILGEKLWGVRNYFLRKHLLKMDRNFAK